MVKILLRFIIAFTLIFVIDQLLKQVFIDGFRYNTEYFSLILTYNKGVAFSLFEWVGEYLKFIQTALIVVIFAYLVFEKKLLSNHSLSLGALLGAGASNIYDRFLHGGVVDYVFWHKWFNFAVFNLADVVIDICIVVLIFDNIIQRKNKEKI